ncbi:MAG: glycerol-3-phosphate cytidylyltransferase [Methanobrevibacter millerae]|uniref:Glycerol-3-phosphate cytidylyltransferase n=1 Tax=Methanobrevibacter millerae TaxID=230361 RepID=A0A8T3VHR3_9EURY|nr:adenylyltransferase/cytidyltransferase family protein [Methanobrevibacter millerae]MBE6505676.1 glycerol-3-phosphate cytidylyltransferase [Methanobrevibacter millerae]
MENKKKYKIGYTCGVFDLFHVGHLNLLENCKKQCETLIVGVCTDEYVIKIKNKTPIFSQEERCRIIEALDVVDSAKIVDIEEVNDKQLAQKIFKFDVLFSGDDWKGTERYVETEKQFAKIDVSIEYLPYTQGISTTLIKNSLNKTQD